MIIDRTMACDIIKIHFGTFVPMFHGHGAARRCASFIVRLPGKTEKVKIGG